MRVSHARGHFVPPEAFEAVASAIGAAITGGA